MKVRHNMVVDFARPSKTNTILVAENDTDSRLIHFTLLNDKEPFDMSDVSFATLEAVTEKGEIIGDSLRILEDASGNKINEVEYSLPNDISSITGSITLRVILNSEAKEVLSSFDFYINVRNSLYKEDDAPSKESLAGFRALLSKMQAALANIENIVTKTAIKNPEALTVKVDGETYVYDGDEGHPVEIEMGYVGYLAETREELEEPIDESVTSEATKAAERAERAALNAEGYKDEALNTLTESNNLLSETRQSFDTSINLVRDLTNEASESAASAKDYYDHINEIVPTVSLTKEGTISRLSISNIQGTQTEEIHDGKDGKDGKDGSKWYRGVNIIGKPSTPTAYATSIEVPNAKEGDNYYNTSTGYIYHCTRAGAPGVALWVYDMELGAGGGGGTGVDNWVDLNDKPFDRLKTNGSIVATVAEDGKKELELADSVTQKLSNFNNDGTLNPSGALYGIIGDVETLLASL